MTDSRKHHFDEKFIIAKLIENDRGESEFGSWSFHNKRYRVDILTGGMVRHNVEEGEGIRKGSSFAIRRRRISCDL
jgi:hypothetical protein